MSTTNLLKGEKNNHEYLKWIVELKKHPFQKIKKKKR